MKLSRTLLRSLTLLVIALTTTLLLSLVVPRSVAQRNIPAPEPLPYPERQPPGKCIPVSSSPGAWLLPVPSNNPPVAKDDQYKVVEKQITVDVLANDSDPNCDRLTVISVTQGSYGNAVINPEGSITYTVTTPTFDNFTYTVSDGRGGTAKATVTVTD